MPIKVGIEFKPIRPKFSKATKIVHTQLIGLWKESVRSYLRKVALEGVIRVRSGMSMASLLPLARAVRMMSMIRAQITAQRKREKPRPYYDFPEGKAPAVGKKTIAHGKRLGEQAFELEFGSPVAPQFVFEFEIRVFHYFINEIGAGPTQAWRSIEKGREAFLATFRAGIPRLNLGGFGEALLGR